MIFRNYRTWSYKHLLKNETGSCFSDCKSTFPLKWAVLYQSFCLNHVNGRFALSPLLSSTNRATWPVWTKGLSLLAGSVCNVSHESVDQCPLSDRLNKLIPFKLVIEWQCVKLKMICFCDKINAAAHFGLLNSPLFGNTAYHCSRWIFNLYVVVDKKPRQFGNFTDLYKFDS